MPQCPDFEYIRNKISIAAVARDLGMAVNGYRAHCWRPESHRNGDADPSVRFQKKQNRGRCFVCDPHSWSTIDLVMSVLGYALPEAISWFTERYTVPPLPKGAHVVKRETWTPRFRAGDTRTVIEMLVRSGLWSTLSHAERSLLPALTTFADQDSGIATISYGGLMQYSGIGSSATISKAVKHFEQMKFVRVVGVAAAGPLRHVNQYHFDFDDPDFHAMVSRVFQQQRAEIELEKQLRAEARKARCKGVVPV